MATKTLIIDDIDGSGEATTVSLSYEGREYEVDLSKKNRSALEKALKPYLDVARQTSGRSRRGPRKTTHRGQSSAGSIDTAAVREWASKNGIAVSTRGRISRDVIEQYRAHG
jgi:hypothetical protein